MSTERDRLRLERETATIILTTARLAVEGRDGARQEVSLAEITDVVVGAAGARAGCAVRVQHWRPVYGLPSSWLSGVLGDRGSAIGSRPPTCGAEGIPTGR